MLPCISRSCNLVALDSRVARSQKRKRPNLAVSKKPQLSNGEEGQINAKFSKKIYQNKGQMATLLDSCNTLNHMQK
jgi:hypothetical protein